MYPAVSTIPTPPFTRIVIAESFYVGQGAQYFINNGIPEIKDIFPPSRITDLHISRHVNTSLQVYLSWTAPGDDFTSGRAASYDIRCSTNRTHMEDQYFNITTLPVHASSVPPPDISGTVQVAIVTVPWTSQVFYYGIVSSDQEGNTSPLSNIVTVWVREIIDTTTRIHECKRTTSL